MTRVLNVHERTLGATAQQVGALVDSLASSDDRLWPSHTWPRMQLDRPLSVGARGGHGPIRYRVEQYLPGECVQFRFEAPRGFHGYHRFEVVPLGPQSIVLKHTLEMTAHGLARVTWPLVFRPLHNALIDDSLATAESTLGESVHVTPRSPQVKFLRWIISRGTARGQLSAERLVHAR